MLKKILFISFLFISFLSKAQSPPFQKPITFGYELSNLLVDNLAGIPNDTFAVPTALRPYAWIARKSGALYLWNSTTFKWEVIVGSGGSDGIGLLHVVGGYGLNNVNDSTVKVDTGLIAKVSRVYNINDSMKLVNAATYVPLTRTITINGVSHDLSSNPSWSVGTIVSSDTTGKWIWAQGNFATMTKQPNNAWYDSSRHQYLRIVGNDSSNYDWLADNQSGTWALFQGKRLTIRDLDTVTSANDDWPFANNVNGIVERITRLVNTRSTAYRHNLFARQVYEVGDSSYVYSIGGDAGSALHSATFLTNIPGTAGRQVIQGGSVPFDAVPVFVSTLTIGPKDEALGISSRRARGYWAPVTSYSNAYAGDTVDHLLYFNATGYDAGAKYLSKTGLYIPIDNNASRTALSWGVYSSDVTGGNSYNLFGGRVGIGDNFGTHTAPSYKTNAALQINSITRGVIFPRMTAAQRVAISVASSDSSLLVWDKDSSRYMAYTGTAWKGIAWTGEGGGSGVTAVGTIDAGTNDAKGANISGNTIYMQTSDGTNPGLLSVKKYKRLFTRQSSANPTGTFTHDQDLGGQNSVTQTTGGGRTLAFSNLVSGDIVVFSINNTSGGAITWTLPSNSYVNFASASTASIPTGLSTLSLYSYDGTNYYFMQSTSNIGDMLKSVYDQNDNGIVDNSTQLNGQAASYYLDRANHTGTQALSTLSNSGGATDDIIYWNGSAWTRLAKGGNNTVLGVNGSGTFGYKADPSGGGITINSTAITSGTAGRILFENSSNQVSNNANLFWDNTNNRLGIGTSSPAVTFHIQSAGASDNFQYTQIIESNQAYNTSPSAGILFRNKYNSGGSYAGMGGMNVGKENASDGDYGSRLSLYTRPNGGSNTEAFRITSAGYGRFLNRVYIGGVSTDPTSSLQINGSLARKYNSTATGITLDINYDVVEVTATGQTITLPTAASITGRIYTIKLTASGSCTVATTSSQTIDGSTTYSLASQYKYVTVQSNGSNWIVIANN